MKLLIPLFMMMTAGANAYAGDELHFATCTYQDSVGSVTPTRTYKIFVVGSPIEPTSASVETTGIAAEEREPVRVSAAFGFHTWTTFMAQFTLNGAPTTIEFAQSLNPSIGILESAGRSQQLACTFSHEGLP
jgi:hypothetical protein